jgi:hypothetical protein
MCMPCAAAREWSLALSNSRPLSHYMDERGKLNCMSKRAKRGERSVGIGF